MYFPANSTLFIGQKRSSYSFNLYKFEKLFRAIIYLILIFYTYLPIIHHNLNRRMKGWDTFAKRNSTNGTKKDDCLHY